MPSNPSPYGDLTDRAFASLLFAIGESLILSTGMLELRSGARVENPTPYIHRSL
ncbi:hypothetical protein FHS26_002992 [Rhizobium pisi]|uniref:Uncharacterized protein n=1 Tax=Rhizobium pisi TaxID=574561 RepID=A0A7W5BLQ2_9HYPH|nr:hypothetical protein [Rhizobium pisi]